MAPRHHTAMRHVGRTRVELGTRTIFNLLGPLSNPAECQASAPRRVSPANGCEPMAQVLARLGSERRLGRPWLRRSGRTDDHRARPMWRELKNGEVQTGSTSTPEDAGLRAPNPEELQGRRCRAPMPTALRAVLAGAQGAYRDIVLLNAAAALMVAGKAATFDGGVAIWRGRHR